MPFSSSALLLSTERPRNPASRARNPERNRRTIANRRDLSEIGRRQSSWAGRRFRRRKREGTVYNNLSDLVFYSKTPERLTSRSRGDEAGEDEEDKRETHGGLEIGGVEGVRRERGKA